VYYIGVNETPYVAISTHVPQPVEVWSKSGDNERHFTLETETVFRPYVASHCSGVTETLHVTLPSHTPQPMPVWSKPVGNKEYFTLEAEKV
jgi:hypothetical protein